MLLDMVIDPVSAESVDPTLREMDTILDSNLDQQVVDDAIEDGKFLF
jgi:hypothetical protein